MLGFYLFGAFLLSFSFWCGLHTLVVDNAGPLCVVIVLCVVLVIPNGAILALTQRINGFVLGLLAWVWPQICQL